MSDITISQQDNFAGPGQELRQARETQGLSLDEVANKLFLSKQRIVDIENDDYSCISSLIYARGYLRAYAKLVGLLEDDILKKFHDLGLQDKKASADSNIILHSKKKAMNKRKGHVHWINIVAVIVLVLLVILWWQGTKRQASSKLSSFKNTVEQVVVPLPVNK